MPGFDVDIPDASFDDAPAETPEAPAPPVAEESPAPEAAPAGDAPEPDTFSRDYVQTLRQESAGYRTKAKPFMEAFDGIADDDRDTFLYLAQTYKTDPAAAAREMSRLAQGLLAEPPADANEGEPKYMTKADYEALRQQERRDDQTKGLLNEARDLGYADGTIEQTTLLLTASKETGGDLKKAHAAIEAKKQAIIDAYIQKKMADAEGASTAGGGPSAPASGERKITTWREAEAAVDEALG